MIGNECKLQMGIAGEKIDIDFIISTGDNFYEDGLTGVNDPAFKESFINIYTAPSLQKQWYNSKFNISEYFNVKSFIYFLFFSKARV